MGNKMEFVGESEAQAVEKACEALGVAREALDYTVVDEGSDGVLGFGSRPVQIRVRAPDEQRSGETVDDEGATDDEERVAGPAPEKAARAEEVSRALLDRMGLGSAGVEVRDEAEQIVVVITEPEGASDVATVLGTTRPPAIPSFQFLLNKIVNRFPEDRKHIVVEVPSVPKPERRAAPERRGDGAASTPDPDLDPSLVVLGRLLAERAQELNKVITVHPMLPADRRAVHQTIMVIDGVSTVSEGEGLYRKMHVVPDSLSGVGGKKKRRRRRRRRRPDESPDLAAEDSAGSVEVSVDGEPPDTAS